MADLKISQLNETTSPSGTDILPIVSEGVTKKVTLDTIASFVSSSDSQTLLFNESTKDLSISSGNTISLSALVDSSTDTGVRSLTSDWQTTFNTVLANSATAWDNSLANQYTHTNFLPLSGGTVSGTQVIDANSTNPALRITQVGTGPAILVEDSTNPDIDPFLVNQFGTLVVGTSAASSGASSSARSAQITTSSSNINGKRLVELRNHGDHSVSNSLRFTKTRSNTNNDFSVILYPLSAYDRIGQIDFHGNGTSVARIDCINLYDAPAGTVNGGYLGFTTLSGNSLQISNNLVLNEGKVGIRTDFPNEALTVVGNISATGTLQLSLTSTPPSNTTTPAAWEDIQVGGVTYKIPLYL